MTNDDHLFNLDAAAEAANGPAFHCGGCGAEFDGCTDECELCEEAREAEYAETVIDLPGCSGEEMMIGPRAATIEEVVAKRDHEVSLAPCTCTFFQACPVHEERNRAAVARALAKSMARISPAAKNATDEDGPDRSIERAWRAAMREDAEAAVAKGAEVAS